MPFLGTKSCLVVTLKPLARGISTVENFIKYATDILGAEMDGPKMERELRDASPMARHPSISIRTTLRAAAMRPEQLTGEESFGEGQGIRQSRAGPMMGHR